MSVNIKPNTYEIFMDYQDEDRVVPLMIAVFGENEKEMATQFLATLKPRAPFPVRLIVKGI